MHRALLEVLAKLEDGRDADDSVARLGLVLERSWRPVPSPASPTGEDYYNFVLGPSLSAIVLSAAEQDELVQWLLRFAEERSLFCDSVWAIGSAEPEVIAKNWNRIWPLILRDRNDSLVAQSLVLLQNMMRRADCRPRPEVIRAIRSGNPEQILALATSSTDVDLVARGQAVAQQLLRYLEDASRLAL